MLRKILTAVGVIALGLLSVVLFVRHQLGTMERLGRAELTQGIPLFQATIRANEAANTLSRDVLASFVVRKTSDLADLRTDARAQLNLLAENLAVLDEPRFAALHATTLPSATETDPATDTPPAAPTASATPAATQPSAPAHPPRPRRAPRRLPRPPSANCSSPSRRSPPNSPPPPIMPSPWPRPNCAPPPR